MADDKTTKMPEQPVTDTGPGKETPPEPEKTPTPPEAEKKTEQQAASPQVSVYDFAEIMKGKKAEERTLGTAGEATRTSERRANQARRLFCLLPIFIKEKPLVFLLIREK